MYFRQLSSTRTHLTFRLASVACELRGFRTRASSVSGRLLCRPRLPCAKKQPIFAEKTSSVFFAIPLVILARKYRIAVDFQEHSPMVRCQEGDSSERTNVPEKCRTPYVSNTPMNITQIVIYGLFSAGSNTCRYSINFTWTINAAGSTGRRNTIQCIDSTMLTRKMRSVWLYSVRI